MTNYNPRCFAEINLGNLAHNYSQIKQKNKNIFAVVKANAYGHGAVKVSQRLEALGCSTFAVADIAEAIELRRANIKADILVLGYAPIACAELFVTQKIIPTIYGSEGCAALNAQAMSKGLVVDVYIMLDTGMGRLGFCPKNKSFSDEIKLIASCKNLNVVGIMTHFSAADSLAEDDINYTFSQAAAFLTAAYELEIALKKKIKKVCSNSAACIEYPSLGLDGARVGISIYGLSSSKNVICDGVLPVMSLKAQILAIREAHAGEYISYGRTYKVSKSIRVATVSVGYADGYPRCLSNKGSMLVGGELANVIGRVTMDYTMLDVTKMNCSVGDAVTVFGDKISIDEVARSIGTIGYEVVCNISARVPRFYID